jgi:predicted ATPase/DNA-binding SARP family transcriptional activator
MAIRAIWGHTRLLTLVGPGGCGKTALALHLARDWLTTFADAVWLVELAPVQDADLLPDLVCRAVGAAVDVTRTPMDRLVAALRERRFLLVLDNCEHLIGRCTCFVEDLLHACPQGHLLTTSREALKSADETIWPVPPLALPEPGARLAPEHLLDSGAIALFVQRACAAVPAFALATGNADLVTQICRRLDGLPLAIELAAGCLKMLSLPQLAAALETAFPLLVAGHRTAPPRQQTLQATMEWSYRLLTREEQALFCRLCVLAGDFGLSLVEAVAVGACEHAPVTLLRLIEKSLVQVRPGDAEARYRLLETVRHFGRQQLQRATGAPEARGEASEEDATMRRYGEWCVALVRTRPAEWDDGYPLWLDRLEIELDHMRACLAWKYAHRQAEQGLRLATTLVGFWRQRDHVGEGCRWLEAGLALDRTAMAPHVCAEALDALGVLRMWQGAYRDAQTVHEEALAIRRAGGDQRGEAMTRFRLGFLADKQDAHEVARAHLMGSLRLFRRLRDPWGVDLSRNRLGVVLLNQGDYSRAERYLKWSLRFLRARHHTGGMASTLLNLGALALAQGEVCQATMALQESLALHETLHDVQAMAYAHLLLGNAACQEPALPEAERQFRTCLCLVTAENSPDLLFRLFDGLGVVAAGHGRTRDAARFWGAMAALRDHLGLRYQPAIEGQRYEQAVAATRARVGELDAQAFDAAWAEGQRLSLDDVFRLAATPELLVLNDRLQHNRPQHNRPQPRGGLPSQGIQHQEDGPPRLRITSLGRVAVYRGEHLVTAAEWPYCKARELLFYLLSHSARSKEQIGLALWPDATPAHLQSSFRVILFHLRRALGDPAWIVREDHHYRFNRSFAYWYDVETFEAAVSDAERQLVSAPDRAQLLLEEAMALYYGDFLDGMPGAEWIMERQEHLRRRHLEALLWLGQLYLACQEVRRARDTFLRAVASDKYAEAAHRGVITCYVRMQEYSQAAHYYAQLRQQFERELGIVPAPETLAAVSPARCAEPE